MKITVLGSGCTWTKELSTSFLINDNFLFDTPQGSYRRILSMIDLVNIHYIYISHFHSDHFAEIHLILEKCKRTNQKLTIIAPKGCKRRLFAMFRVFDVLHLIRYVKKYVTFVTMKHGKTYQDENYKLTFYKMQHVGLLCFGCVFEEGNKKIAFSADTCMCASVHELLQNANVAFLDTAAVQTNFKHLSVKEVAQLQQMYPQVTIYSVHGSVDSWSEGKNICRFVHDKQIIKI